MAVPDAHERCPARLHDTPPRARCYPDTTLGPAPGAPHRFAARVSAPRMSDATAEKNLIAARIVAIAPPAGRRPDSQSRVVVEHFPDDRLVVVALECLRCEARFGAPFSSGFGACLMKRIRSS